MERMNDEKEAHRIRIAKGERVEIQVSYAEVPTCNGRNARGYMNTALVGPVNLCAVVSKIGAKE
jgi:hypothetical protein